MNAFPPPARPTLLLTTPTPTTIAMTRAFNAPRRLAWEAMTNPAKLREWMFAPPGWTMTTCEFSPRLGGTYRWQWCDASDVLMTIHGEITECSPHERLVHTQIMEMGPTRTTARFLVALELSENGDTTRMLLTLTFPSMAERDQALTWGMERGMEVGYARLDSMLAQAA